MSYPQFSGYQLGSIVQDIADLETKLGGAITNLRTDISGVVADVDSVKTEVLTIPKSPIKSIQRGTITIASNNPTVNISAVNISKSVVKLNTTIGLSTLGQEKNSLGVYLSSGSVIQFITTRVTNNDGLHSGTAYWEVIEYI